MIIEKYTFNNRFTRPAFLPQFKGSTIRGGLGVALKKISCALRYQKCESCLLFETCAYAFLFEVKKGHQQRPHPYVIIPPDSPQRTFKEGEEFFFKIILFGRANDYLPHIIYAVKEMGKNGLGKNQHDQGQMVLETACQGTKTIFADNQLGASSPLQHVELTPSLPSNSNRLTIDCQTPLRLKYSNELRSSLPFHLLVRAALRRISSLETAYGTGEPELDYKGIVARATKIKVDKAECRWQDIKRYSNRQRQAMMLGGIKGRISYKGETFSEFLPLIHYCQQTHLGKQTSFGLGKIAIEPDTIP